MSPRQRAFCRHYLICNDAIRAARQAGYTRSVADTNAARILSSPAVQAWLERQRMATLIVSGPEMLLIAHRCRQLLQDPSAPPKEWLRAAAELRAVARACQKMPPEAFAPNAVNRLPTSPDIFGLQPAENESELNDSLLEITCQEELTETAHQQDQAAHQAQTQQVQRVHKDKEPSTHPTPRYSAQTPPPEDLDLDALSSDELRQVFNYWSKDYHNKEMARLDLEHAANLAAIAKRGHQMLANAA